jgi:hypothetical protein
LECRWVSLVPRIPIKIGRQYYKFSDLSAPGIARINNKLTSFLEWRKALLTSENIDVKHNLHSY